MLSVLCLEREHNAWTDVSDLLNALRQFGLEPKYVLAKADILR